MYVCTIWNLCIYIYTTHMYTHEHNEHTLYCIVLSSIMYNYYYYYIVYCIYHIYIGQQQEILFVYTIERDNDEC